jgi:membrane protease YdiL (CAAX protease family)
MKDKLVAWCVLVGAVSAVAWAGNLAGGPTQKDAVYKYSTGITELILFGVILAAVLWIARGLPKREAFALRAPRSWGRAVGLAIGVFLLIWLVSYALDPLLHPGKEQGLTPSSWQPAHAAAFGLNVFALAVVGPVVEELTFRGLGFTLLERYGQTAAIIVIGIAFGVWHGLIDALPVLIVFGTGLAFLRSRTQSVYPGMLLHGLFNGLALLIAVTIQR